ncbi:efflux transporter outer membrane subunit [Paucibacter sp. R3-3]|uniref:Efflux transporter outer membrane subunit n=1 Tax=Roseateles agri TaxID=3098619 RepID=A0ABU5DRU5_9BURK|nr:efflux transporter outer membrane subunit [Paucibacter sp. R3-3]MDY0749042.1 efflux transporter outer membrane subunit [Paucibacter sp. R3-3]
MTQQRVAGLLAAVLLSACATPGHLSPPQETLKGAAIGLSADNAAKEPALAERWWEVFGDAALDQLIDKALQDNPSLAAAGARLRRAAAAVARVESNDTAQVAARFDATSQRFPEHALYPPNIAGTHQEIGSLQAGLSWELDFFGRNKAALEAALGSVHAAQADAQGARLLLASSVTRNYLQLARLLEQRRIALRTFEQRSEVLALTRRRVQAGLDTAIELRQGEGALPDTRQAIEALDEQIVLRRHALAALAVQPPTAMDGLAPQLLALHGAQLPERLPADLLGRRADIDAARLRVEAATQELKAARADFYPSINLIAFAGYNAIGLNRLLEAGSEQYGAGPALRLPLFDGGRLRSALQGRAAELDLAIAAYNGALLEAVRETSDQIASLQSIARQQEQQDLAQLSAESAYALAVRRYEAGLGSYLIVLSTESAVLIQRRSHADLLARALDSQVELMRALGGGYVADALADPLHARR